MSFDSPHDAYLAAIARLVDGPVSSHGLSLEASR